MKGIRKFKNDLKENTNSLDVERDTFRNIVTGNIYRMMSNDNINKSDLAKSLKVSKPAVTKMLSGDRNFTIDKIIEICHYLGYNPNISFKKKFQLDKNQTHLLLDYFKKKEKKIIISTEDKNTDCKTEIQYTETDLELIQIYNKQDYYYEKE